MPVFRGSEDDVLDRVYRCARQFGMEVLVKFTGDNPLIDPDVIDEVVGYFLAEAEKFDYVSNLFPSTWPDGQELQIIRLTALEAAWRESTLLFDREHVTPFIWQRPGRFRIANVEGPDHRWRQEHRWTLDFPEDYEFIRRIFEALYPRKNDFTLKDVMDLVARQPDIAALNAQHRMSA